MHLQAEVTERRVVVVMRMRVRKRMVTGGCGMGESVVSGE
jgi:hypothetical protein